VRACVIARKFLSRAFAWSFKELIIFVVPGSNPNIVFFLFFYHHTVTPINFRQAAKYPPFNDSKKPQKDRGNHGLTQKKHFNAMQAFFQN
jgi:hypothetical protein